MSAMLIVKKIIIRYFLFLVYLASCLVPRNKDKWVLGSLEDFGGNAKYLYAYLIENSTDVRAIWITKNRNLAKEMQERGVDDFLYFYSISGVFHMLTAGVYVTTHDLSKSLSIWTLGRAKWINLWHGVGIKALRFNSNSKLLNFIYSNKLLKAVFYPYGFHLFYKPDVFLSTSPLMHDHFRQAFDFDEDTILSGGYPRCFYLKDLSLGDTKVNCLYGSSSLLQQVEFIRSFSYVYIYMPTWRKAGDKYVTSLALDFDRLQMHLAKENELFILKLHPLMSERINIDFNAYSNILKLDDKLDVYGVLPFTDALIGDYSSIYYDYILMDNKSVLLYPYDYDEYVANSRDLAFNFDEYTPGKRVYDFDQLLNALRDKELTSTSAQEIKEVCKAFWDYEAESNQELVEHIKARI